MIQTRLWATAENRRRITGYKSMYADDAPGWIAGRRALKQMGVLCREKGVPFVVAIFPLFGNPLDEGYPFAEIHVKVAQAAAEAGAKVVDLLPVYRGLRWDILVVDGVDDEHPNDDAQTEIHAKSPDHCRHIEGRPETALEVLTQDGGFDEQHGDAPDAANRRKEPGTRRDRTPQRGLRSFAGGCLDDGGVVGQAEIIVGAEIDDLAAADQNRRPLRALELTLVLGKPLSPNVLKLSSQMLAQ